MKMTQHKKHLPVMGLLLAAALLLTACGGASADKYSASTAASPDYYGEDTMAAAAPAAGTNGPNVTMPQDERKVTMTVQISMETTAFDDTCQKLETAAAKAGGYIFSTNIDGQQTMGDRSAWFSMKIPPDAYAEFLKDIGGAGTIMNRSEHSEDVTNQYVDIAARLKSLRAQEERLLEMMGQAGKLEDVILIQEQLTEVQYEIETYLAHQRSLEGRIAYSTVDISLYEVRKVTEFIEDSYFAKIGKAFRDSWDVTGKAFQALGIVLVWLIPVLLIVAAVLVIVLLAYRANKKKKATNPVAPTQPGPIPGQMPPYLADAPYSPYPPYPVPRVGPAATERVAPTIPGEKSADTDNGNSNDDRE